MRHGQRGYYWIARIGVTLLLLASLAASLTRTMFASPAPAAPAAVAASPDTHAQVAAQYGKLPLAFEANTGQADPAARFVAHAHGFTLALSPDALTMVVGGRQSVVGSNSGDTASSALRFAFAGANPAPMLASEEPLPGVANYFIGNDPAQWHTNVPTAAQVRYTGLYPGIDLTVYGNDGGELEYDAIFAPGTAPHAFALSITGADTVALVAETGELVLSTAAGEVRQHAPVAYQERGGQRMSVAARYDLRGDGSVGFAVGAYDPALPLVIDPSVTLAYATYLGGTGDDQGNGIAVDTIGNAYITGFTKSADFPITPGTFQTTNHSVNFSNVFVTKLNATGTALVYSTYLGGTSEDVGNAIAVDANGNAFITGYAESGNFPTTAGAFQTASGSTSGTTDAFVTKLNAMGTALVYSTYIGGSTGDQGSGIAIDGNGNAYVAGFTLSANFPTTTGAFQTTLNGGAASAVVFKLNATGTTLFYSTYLDGTIAAEGFAIAIDATGDAYVTGQTISTDFPTTAGAFQTTFGGNRDAFVTKLNPTGTALIYSTYLGGSNQDYGNAIAVDSGGNAYITGWTISANFPTTTGAVQTTFGGIRDAFVTRLNATGTALVYSTYLGGGQFDMGMGIAVDSSGSAYVTGYTDGMNFPITSGALQTVGGGTNSVFMTKLNATGTALLYSTYLSGYQGSAIAIDANSNAYIAGITKSTGISTTAGAVQTTYGGGVNDAFALKLASTLATPTPASQPTRHAPTATIAGSIYPQPTPMHTPAPTRAATPIPQPTRH